MATRFYLPLTGTAPSSPTVSTGWSYSASSFARYPTETGKAGSYVWTNGVWPGTADETGYSCLRQYVSPPLDVDQTISGTVSMAIGVKESSTLADAYLCYSVRVLQGDTSTERGVLKAPAFADTEVTTGGITRIVNAVAVTSVNGLAGDRIVIEVGHRFVTPAAGASADLLLGNPNYTDLPLTSGVAPANQCCWLELSSNITFSAGATQGSTNVIGNVGFSGSNATAKTSNNTAVGSISFSGANTTSKTAAANVIGSFGFYGSNIAVNAKANNIVGNFGFYGGNSTSKRSGTNATGNFGFSANTNTRKTTFNGAVGSFGFFSSNQSSVGTGGLSDVHTWHITRPNATTGIEENVTSFTVTPRLRLFRPGDLRAWDFADPGQGFKPSSECVQIDAYMLARDGTTWPGFFDYRLKTTELGVGGNVTYQLSATATDDLGNKYSSEFDICYRDGIRQWGGMTVPQDTALTAVPSAAQIAMAVVEKVIP